MDIDDLIAKCRRNNQRALIARMLHYNGDNFLQVLRGWCAEVCAIYHRIARDPRISNFILISCQDESERTVPACSMGMHEGVGDQARDIFLC